MLVLAMSVSEEPVTYITVEMFLEAVYAERIVAFKVAAAFATIVMTRTLGPVLFEAPLRVKVPITIIAVVVIRGV